MVGDSHSNEPVLDSERHSATNLADHRVASRNQHDPGNYRTAEPGHRRVVLDTVIGTYDVPASGTKASRERITSESGSGPAGRSGHGCFRLHDAGSPNARVCAPARWPSRSSWSRCFARSWTPIAPSRRGDVAPTERLRGLGWSRGMPRGPSVGRPVWDGKIKGRAGWPLSARVY